MTKIKLLLLKEADLARSDPAIGGCLLLEMRIEPTQ
jgi:hypothetical protein